MLNATSELAIRALILLGLKGEGGPMSPKALATFLECSPTYLGKTLGLLVKAGVLQSVRGAHGGVLLAKDPKQISLLNIVEACQGLFGTDYCRETAPAELEATCRYHQVMWKLRTSVMKTLAGCSLADLIACPVPRKKPKADEPACRTSFLGIEQLITR